MGPFFLPFSFQILGFFARMDWFRRYLVGWLVGWLVDLARWMDGLDGMGWDDDGIAFFL